MSPLEQLDVALFRLGIQLREVLALALRQRAVAVGVELADTDAPAFGEIDHLAGEHVAQVLAQYLESLVAHVLAHELDVAGTDVRGHLGQHTPAADQLDLEIFASAAELEDVVD